MMRLDSLHGPRELPLTFVGDVIEEETQGVVFNLSLAGCTIRSRTAVPARSFLRLVIHAANGPITIPMAVVRWATTHQFGVDFLILPVRERAKLIELVWTFQDGSPAHEELGQEVLRTPNCTMDDRLYKEEVPYGKD